MAAFQIIFEKEFGKIFRLTKKSLTIVCVCVCVSNLSFLTESVTMNNVINEGLKWIKAALALALLLHTKSFSGWAEQYATLSILSDMAIYQSAAATLTSANLIETDLADRKPHGRTIQSHSSATARPRRSVCLSLTGRSQAGSGSCSSTSAGKLSVILGKVMKSDPVDHSPSPSNEELEKCNRVKRKFSQWVCVWMCVSEDI